MSSDRIDMRYSLDGTTIVIHKLWLVFLLFILLLLNLQKKQKMKMTFKVSYLRIPFNQPGPLPCHCCFVPPYRACHDSQVYAMESSRSDSRVHDSLDATVSLGFQTRPFPPFSQSVLLPVALLEPSMNVHIQTLARNRRNRLHIYDSHSLRCFLTAFSRDGQEIDQTPTETRVRRGEISSMTRLLSPMALSSQSWKNAPRI